MKPVFKYTYAKWREDKEAESGCTKELIAVESENISDQTTLDSLEVFPFQDEKAGKVGIQTLHQAFIKNLHKIPNRPMLGTKN